MVFGPRGQPVLAKLNPDRREARGLEIHAELHKINANARF
jgi:hypothetical protein